MRGARLAAAFVKVLNVCGGGREAQSAAWRRSHSDPSHPRCRLHPRYLCAGLGAEAYNGGALARRQIALDLVEVGAEEDGAGGDAHQDRQDAGLGAEGWGPLQTRGEGEGGGDWVGGSTGALLRAGSNGWLAGTRLMTAALHGMPAATPHPHLAAARSDLCKIKCVDSQRPECHKAEGLAKTLIREAEGRALVQVATAYRGI